MSKNRWTASYFCLHPRAPSNQTLPNKNVDWLYLKVNNIWSGQILAPVDKKICYFDSKGKTEKSVFKWLEKWQNSFSCQCRHLDLSICHFRISNFKFWISKFENLKMDIFSGTQSKELEVVKQLTLNLYCCYNFPWAVSFLKLVVCENIWGLQKFFRRCRGVYTGFTKLFLKLRNFMNLVVRSLLKCTSFTKFFRRRRPF